MPCRDGARKGCVERLREKFSQAIFDAIRECHGFGYHPSKWEAMNRTQHPIETSTNLVQKTEFQDWFKKFHSGRSDSVVFQEE